MNTFAIVNGIFLTMDPERPEVRGTMLVKDGVIAKLSEGAPDPRDLEGIEVVDGRHRLYLPGFVNTHGHAAMSLLRGYADDLALKVWLEEKMWPKEALFTAADVRAGALLSIVEMLKGGTTCFVDMYDHMDEVAQAVAESGMRACLTRGMIGFGPEEVQRAKLAEAKSFARRWHGQADGRITAMMAPHAPYTCPPDFIRKVVDIAHELDLPIHTHLSETAKEVEDHVRQYGVRPPAHLRDLGVFSRPCLVAHAVHLTDDEIELLKAHDVRVSHNPGSNLKLASGIARVPDLLRAGVKVSLGTDSSASNNNLDMLEEIRLAALLHKGVSGDPTAVPAMEALRMGTAAGAESIWLARVGMLKPGMKADLIAVDIDQPHFYPQENLASHLVYAASAKDVTDVWVDGRRLVRRRELTTLDEEKVVAEFNASYRRIMAG
jgi:5-methylthioadenosine/S-adenosylhomocysteine deaminase